MLVQVSIHTSIICVYFLIQSLQFLLIPCWASWSIHFECAYYAYYTYFCQTSDWKHLPKICIVLQKPSGMTSKLNCRLTDCSDQFLVVWAGFCSKRQAIQPHFATSQPVDDFWSFSFANVNERSIFVKPLGKAAIQYNPQWSLNILHS